MIKNSQKLCEFCDRSLLERGQLIVEKNLVYAIWDKYPASPGHALIIPTAHVVSFFDLSDPQAQALYQLAREIRDVIKAKFKPNGFNIGVNDGVAAGRMVHHLHVHMIPRYKGDVKDPSQGIKKGLIMQFESKE